MLWPGGAIELLGWRRRCLSVVVEGGSKGQTLRGGGVEVFVHGGRRTAGEGVSLLAVAVLQWRGLGGRMRRWERWSWCYGGEGGGDQERIPGSLLACSLLPKPAAGSAALVALGPTKASANHALPNHIVPPELLLHCTTFDLIVLIFSPQSCYYYKA